MKLYVIRHGETNMGKKELIATEEEPLNENGIIQAKELKKNYWRFRLRYYNFFTINKSKTYIYDN